MDKLSVFLVIIGGLLLAGVTALVIWNSIREKSARPEDGNDLNNAD